MVLLVSAAAAEEPVYREDFERYAAQSRLDGWVDSLYERPARRRAVAYPASRKLFETGVDPADASNRVYGIQPAVATGAVSTYAALSFRSPLQFTGRFLRTDAATFPGLLLMEQAYALLLRESTMQLVLPDGRSLDSTYSPQPGLWTFFRVEVDRQRLRAKFWIAGTPEPAAFSIETAVPEREGRIALWAAGSGGVFFDDLEIRAEAEQTRSDVTPPRIGFYESGTRLDPSRPAVFRREVTIEIRVDDESPVSWEATLDGSPYRASAISAEGAHTLRVRAADIAGNTSEAAFAFTIDTTVAGLAFTSPIAGQIIGTARPIVKGTYADAAEITVNGVRASLDPQTRTFIAGPIDLLEGPNRIVAAADSATAEMDVAVDTRPAELTVLTPRPNACIDASSVEIRGSVFDPNLDFVRVGPADATLAEDKRSWSASIDAGAEGPLQVIVEAVDLLGHTSRASIDLDVDRTAPGIQFFESGQPFAGGLLNRAVSLGVSADEEVEQTVTLNGAPWQAGSPIAEEREHQVKVVARDCAGHTTERSVTFTIDRSPPQILTIEPGSGSVVGTTPEIRGTASADTASIRADSQAKSFDVTAGAFVLSGLALKEGRNEIELIATDRAGNSARLNYSVTLKLRAPTLEILENGVLIGPGTLFNRAVTPAIRSSDPAATIAATLNGQLFAPGTTIDRDGTFTLSARAKDSLGHTSDEAVATFTIDATPPSVSIVSPATGASVSTDRIDVRGTASADVAEVTVNGINVPAAGGAFVANVPLERGPNLLVASTRDRAGNIAADSVEVNRSPGPPAIVLTSPPDGLLTNRRTAFVAGQIFSTNGAVVTVAGNPVPVDVTGAFRRTDFALAEGENVITAAVRTAGGEVNEVSVRVRADRTPPRVRVLESGQGFQDGARFAAQAAITADASDGGEVLPVELILDGVRAAQPEIVTAAGVHVVTALARDAAGNESRVERSFTIGSAGAQTCVFDGIDPPGGATITSSTVTVTGRCGNAAGVVVNGRAALVSNGSFCATVELPAEGSNSVTFGCVNAAGEPVGMPAVLTLVRATSDPSIAIDTPAEGAIATTETLAVNGTVAGGVTSVIVNGVAAALTGSSFAATSVRLAPGINLITATARGASGRTVVVSRRVNFLKSSPAISMTSPPAGLVTGAAQLDLSGAWSDLDPSALSSSTGDPVTVSRQSDTTGTFLVRAVTLVEGDQTFTVQGRDAAGRPASAQITVTRRAAAPSITITEPADLRPFPANAGDTIAVRGTFSAAPGSRVEVAGAAANIAGSDFTATVPFASIPGGSTPVIARVLQPDGETSIDIVRVTKLSARPKVIEAIPAPGSAEIDPGSVVMVLFSAPMDRATLETSVRVESASGAQVAGTLHLDRDVLTFAPAVPYTSGERYTIRIGAAARDVAGNALEGEHVSAFTVSAASPRTAPVLAGIPPRICAQQLQVSGSAPAGARVRIDFGGLSFTTTASTTGTFSLPLPLSGRSGFAAVRARIVAADGSMSPAAEVCFLVDCAGPQVTEATFDRAANRIRVLFSKEIDASTAAGAVRLQVSDGRLIAASTTMDAPPRSMTIVPSEDLSKSTVTLTIGTSIRDLDGTALAIPFTTTFGYESDQPPVAGDGSGYVTGEVFDAETGRPFAGAAIAIGVPAAAFGRTPSRFAAETLSVGSATDARGRYAAQLPEGAHTIEVSAPGFERAWRQIVVPAGAGVSPIDLRLAPRGATAVASAGESIVRHRGVELRVPAGAVAAGTSLSLTAIDGQSLPGLLPLGWSPLGAATVASGSPSLSASQLVFDVPEAAVTSGAQVLTAVQYFDDRDEWRVVNAAAPIVEGRTAVPISAAGTYALVYPDRLAHLRTPSPPVAGGTLTGVSDPCASAPCPPLVARAFVLDPPAILPDGRTRATLTIDGADPARFPSGTAVQASIQEELRLADGSRISEPPFTTDLMLYRTLSGESAVAQFNLAASPRASEVVLEVGFSTIRIHPYPGRVDRGALVGPEGGRVAGESEISVEVPAGATTEALHASARAIADAQNSGPIAGFTIVAGFELTLQRASGEPSPVELLKPARATLRSGGPAGAQMILIEIVESPLFGRIYRLAALMDRLDGDRVTTRSVDRATLPLDGLIREGRYLLLAAQSPIAFATGLVRVQGVVQVRTPALGVADLTRPGGAFVIPVPAQPAAPFVLTPRAITIGDGASYTHTASPSPGAIVNVGELPLTAQPPVVVSTVPAHGASDVGLAPVVKVTFAPAIDPQSVRADSLTVTDAATGRALDGKLAAEGTSAMVWSLPVGERLQPARRYVVTVSPAVRAPNGAPLGRPHVFLFSTLAQVSSGEVHPERIRITIPDANGRSRVTGDPGALPAGWNAVVTRRGRDFATRFQQTAGVDGSFAIAVEETVVLTDEIDLQVINSAGAVAAIIPLTPFVTNDARGFIAPPDRPVRFTSRDGISIDVPAGAFETPTMVTVSTSDRDAVAVVPAFERELNYAASIDLQFDGVASKPLQVEIPVPQGTDTTAKEFMLGWRGESVRGPRIMIVDTLRIENGRFTTAPPPGSSAPLRQVTTALTGQQVKSYLNQVNRSGIYVVIDIKVNVGATSGVAWAVMDGIAGEMDLFWDVLESLYAAAFYVAERGRVAMPVPVGKQFQVVGVDAGTGLQAFSKVYDPLPPGDPGAGYVIPTGNPDTRGPHPVSGTPMRIEVLDVDAEDVEIPAIRNFVIRQTGGLIFALDSADPLPPDVEVSLLNVTRGEFDPSRAGGLYVSGEAGDRIVLFIEERQVDPSTTFSVLFSEPIYLGPLSTSDDAIDQWMRQVTDLEKAEPGSQPFDDIEDSAYFRVDSGGRRLTIELDSLQRGATYRLSLKRDLADASGPGGKAGLTIGQAVVGGQKTQGLADPVRLLFRVREPGGALASFDLPDGAIRDQALNGNILLIAAQSAGLYAYDTADPAGLGTGVTPLAVVNPAATQFWSVATDHHGRVFATGLTSMTGVLHSYRLEDFVDPAVAAPRHPRPRSGSFVSWAPGAGASIGLASGLIAGDRPEAIPRKLQILLQDDEMVYDSRAAFLAATNGSRSMIDPEFDAIMVALPMTPGNPYALQRITVENMTLDLRWSADASDLKPAAISGILARAGDRIRVLRNRFTYASIALFGYGVGIYDLNAIEANDFEGRPAGYRTVRELVRMTRASLRTDDPWAGNPCALPGTDTWAIPDLTFTPETAILTQPGSPALNVYALDPLRGVLDLSIMPPLDSSQAELPPDLYMCERSPFGLVFRAAYQDPAGPAFHDHPRLLKLRQIFEQIASRPPHGRYNQLAHYRWRLEAPDNKPVGLPATAGAPAPGARGSAAGTAVERDYLLVAANEYGLLVVEVGGNPAAAFPGHRPLADFHLVDVIWAPSGIVSVRAIPRTNLATAIDGQGHALLIDLSRLDERFDVHGQPIAADALFPTVRQSLRGRSPMGIGELDPRIVWRSAIPAGHGTLAPLIDPDTGIAYIGQLTQKTMNVVAAIDPRIQLKADLGAPDGLSEVGGVVPLGIDPPAQIKQQIASAHPLRQPDASLAAFRIELTLPGAITDKLSTSGNRIHVAVESERVPGAAAEQTSMPYPRSHLRVRAADGSADPRPAADFYLQRVVPAGVAPAVRHQRGYNRFISPWIVAVADPRAALRYTWPQGTTAAQKEAEGCFSCDRPDHLKGKTEADNVWEIYSLGRAIAIRPDFCASNCAVNLFSGTPYAYLGSERRLVTRFATVMADTIRPPRVLVAAQNPPVANGAIQDTLYVHSGEVESGNVDLDAGGRSGWNVVFDRTYRSRTIGGTPHGYGWDSSVFKRVRPLPNGSVEYRDGRGEIWLFTQKGTSYSRPKGLFLTLTRTERGWRMTDAKLRVTDFDHYGRMVSEGDEFVATASIRGSGNVVRYVYGVDGLLAQVIDPVGRISSLRYDGGRLREIEDWRGRTIRYEHDSGGRLVTVELPDVANVNQRRPAIRYSYEGGSATFNDTVEIATNLRQITEPADTTPRIRFLYGTGQDRDRLVGQEWVSTSESVKVSYPAADQADVEDAMKQERSYALSAPPIDYYSDRPHILTLEERNVLTSTIPIGTLPQTASVTTPPPRKPQTRRFEFGYDDQGLLVISTLAGVRKTIYTYTAVPGTPALVLVSTTTRADGPAPGTPITRTVEYQTSNGAPTTFVQAIATGAEKIESPEAHRGNAAALVSTNDGVETTSAYDDSGQLRKVVTRGGTDPLNSTGSETGYDFFPASAPLHARSLLRSVSRPGVNPITRDYPTPDRMVEVDERGVRTESVLDAWLRPSRVTVTGPGMIMEESSQFDASGRVRIHQRRQDPLTVTTNFEYDAVGRVLKVVTDQVAVGGVMTTISESTSYDLGTRTVTKTTAGGSVITEQLDGLGRVTTRTTTTGSTPLREEFVYDMGGNLVWHADDHVVTVSAYDAHGRAIKTLNADGTRTETAFDDWGRSREVKTVDASGAVVSESNLTFTPAGRLTRSESKVGAATTRIAEMAWDGAGRPTVSATSGRVSRRTFDRAGRLVTSVFGGGTIGAIHAPMQQVDVSGYDGSLIAGADVREKSGLAIGTSYAYDTAGGVVQQTVGTLGWLQTLDQAGNVKSSALPHRPAATFDHDGRSALTRETKPGGAAIDYRYDAAGGTTQYRDPTSEVTESVNDLLGRPRSRTYADGTKELFEYEGQRLRTMTDRQGRTFHYTYTDQGQVWEIRAGGGAVLDKFEYDSAGRMTKWTTADAELAFENFDLEGRPRKTTQTRRDSAGNVIDSYSQEHVYNEHGERVEWTMPSYAGWKPAGSWTTRLRESRDDAGNIARIERNGTLFMEAQYRNAGRPDRRTVTTTGGPVLERTYAYNANGQMSEMSVQSRGLVVAGSRIAFDGLQIARAELLGLSGGARADEYTYDDRSRLLTSSHARPVGSPAPAIEVLTASDFRSELQRKMVEPQDPPAVVYTETAGHKVASAVSGADTRTFAYQGAERIGDGTSTQQYDARGRVVMTTNAAAKRRVRYHYDGRNRIVGRRSEYEQSGSWKLEDRADILADDGLPADTTWCWDAVTDQLVAIWVTGASANPSVDPQGGLVRQFVHGGLGYDDPIEVAMAEGTSVRRLYPVFDEAGAGNLQIVANTEGEIVSRHLVEGPYAEDEASLAGAGVDRIAITAKKDAKGNLTSVSITIRLTESLDSASVATGAIVEGLSASATLEGESTIRWDLTAAQWTALLAASPTLTIAVTDRLRAAAWPSGTAILPPPDWALTSKPVFTSPTRPVEYREATATLASWATAIAAGSEATLRLYEIENLAAMGSRPENLLVVSSFQALPFADPATGLVYARERWLDPRTGTFLSPDPARYRDSSNLYTFAAGDPVNGRDPTGEIVVVMHGIRSRGPWAMEMARGLRMGWLARGGDVRQDVINLVNERSPGKTFNERNALRAGVFGKLDAETMQAGQRVANLLGRLRRHLDESQYHRDEPIHVIAHSHGTSMLLAAARVGQGQMNLGTVIIAGSDMHPNMDLSSLTAVAQRVISYYSTEDDTTGLIGAAGGGAGFKSSQIIQRHVPAVDHTRGRAGERKGQLAWMTDDLSKKYYAGDTLSTDHPQGERILKEDWTWIKEYIEIRSEMGGGYGQLPLP